MKNLYADEQKKTFESVFENPASLYRDTPFWAWNCKLDKAQLFRQIEVFRKMGMGGFHMHARTGLGTEYLGSEFMELVKSCVADAKSLHMLAWLYDEDRWPSGAAGGRVTCNPKFRARYLMLCSEPLTTEPDATNDDDGKLLCCHAVKFDSAGRLESYRRCEAQEELEPGFRKFYSYRMIQEFSHWFNDFTYVDTLNPQAINRFVEVTYEAYFRNVGKEFNQTIPAIFTDEPQFCRKSVLKFAQGKECSAKLPFTDDLPESYRAAYGADFFETLPELLWERADGKYSLARYRYHDHIAERFASAFADTIGSWCEQHNIRFSGHLMDEPRLESQTHALGEAMRSYRSFQLPGIDMLCDWRELSTAKQAQSASRQFGRGGVLSELDGVTDWDFNFAGHKGHGDWQAALGVTVRVPHLAWVSMAGEAKRDYPASISYQSPWHEKYPLIADHFARVNAAMTRGVPVCRVGVIHPIESYWLIYGPQDQTAFAREQAEENFQNLPEWLLEGLIDFDFIAESLLPEQWREHSDGKFHVGEMAYSVVVVPPTITLRNSTLDALESFAAHGGRVIFAGNVATLCDAEESFRAAELAKRCEQIAFSRSTLLHALENIREISVRNADGYPARKLLAQIRDEDGVRYLFLANTLRCGKAFRAELTVNGEYQLEQLDTSSGKIEKLSANVADGKTVLGFDCYPHGHLLLRMTRAGSSVGTTLRRMPLTPEEQQKRIRTYIEGEKLPITLSEPNVLLLDLARWRTDNGNWEGTEEVLRLDNLARLRFGIGIKTGNIVQPWAAAKDDRVYGVLEMEFAICAKIDTPALELALEQPENTELFLDGMPLFFNDCGYWTDEAIRKTPFPALCAGTHKLTVRRRYTAQTNVERMYLLGDFGVELTGRNATLTAPVRTLHWGDAATQGLPFYGGNITYHAQFHLNKALENGAVRFSSRIANIPDGVSNNQAFRECEFAGYQGTLVSVMVDGASIGDAAFAPYELQCGTLCAGDHKADFTLYGSRMNSFGAVHLTNRIAWIGPDACRSEGDLFSYEYRITPLGILRSPMVVE